MWTMPLIGMSGMPQARVGVVDQPMQLIGYHMHLCNSRMYITVKKLNEALPHAITRQLLVLKLHITYANYFGNYGYIW